MSSRTATDADRVADDLVERAVDSDGDLVLVFGGRIGATPYARFTPYTNADGVRVHHWTVLSVVPKAMPGRAMLFRPELIEPDESEDYPLRYFTTEWIRWEARRSPGMRLEPARETPFAGDAWRYERTDEPTYVVYTTAEGGGVGYFLEVTESRDAAKRAMDRWWHAFASGEKREHFEYDGITFRPVSEFGEWEDGPAAGEEGNDA